ncbi:DNA polymerase IV [bacterium AH-315-L15]|nr:DNA polymerase IV [bacterium AH-315-L15]
MILHVDMDAFYASIEEREQASLRGKPVIVGGSPKGRGVVAAANYKARAFGVHSAMPSSKAFRICPEAVFLPPRIHYYTEVSEQIQSIFKAYTPRVEPLSLDEAFLDVCGSEACFGSAETIGLEIKVRIREEIRLCASVGIAPNKFVAKVASDLGKPDGFVVVRSDDIQDFLDPLPVGRLWGVGKASDRVLAQIGIRTIAQLRRQSRPLLHNLFGKWGDQLWELAHGRDARPVIPDREAKSISHETTFEKDLHDVALLRSTLVALTEQVAWRLRRYNLRARTVEVKIRFSDFKTITRSKTLVQATHTTQDLVSLAIGLLHKHLPKKHLGIRLIGMGASQLATGAPVQGELFLDEAAQKQQRLDAAADRIQAKYGTSALKRASRLSIP